MSFIPWDVPIKADSYRSTDLKEYRFNRNGLILVLVEEETEQTWCLSFESLQAFRTTTEECSAKILEQLPASGGFFKSTDSAWLSNLGKGEIPFLMNACHFVICCYDEINEIVADASSPKFLKNN